MRGSFYQADYHFVDFQSTLCFCSIICSESNKTVPMTAGIFGPANYYRALHALRLNGLVTIAWLLEHPFFIEVFVKKIGGHLIAGNDIDIILKENNPNDKTNV